LIYSDNRPLAKYPIDSCNNLKSGILQVVYTVCYFTKKKKNCATNLLLPGNNEFFVKKTSFFRDLLIRKGAKMDSQPKVRKFATTAASVPATEETFLESEDR
jgi:hypothetical protein